MGYRVMWESDPMTEEAVLSANRFRYQVEEWMPMSEEWQVILDFDMEDSAFAGLFATVEEARDYAEARHRKTGKKYRVADTQGRVKR